MYFLENKDEIIRNKSEVNSLFAVLFVMLHQTQLLKGFAYSNNNVEFPRLIIYINVRLLLRCVNALEF